MFLLPIESYDIILGIQWLKTLGSISWNFVYLTMHFLLNGKQYCLLGSRSNQCQVVNVFNVKELEDYQKVFDS